MPQASHSLTTPLALIRAASFAELTGAFVAAEAETHRRERAGRPEPEIEEASNRAYFLRSAIWSKPATTLEELAFKLALAIAWAEETGPEPHSPLRRALADLRALARRPH